jgi:hypothetical protein
MVPTSRVLLGQQLQKRCFLMAQRRQQMLARVNGNGYMQKIYKLNGTHTNVGNVMGFTCRIPTLLFPNIFNEFCMKKCKKIIFQ